jgi:hypothetical protein
MNYRPCSRAAAIFTVAIIAMVCTAPQGRADNLERIAEKQRQEREAFRERIADQYKRMHEKWKTREGPPPGVTPLVMKAIEMSIFYEGQEIKELEPVFGKDKMLEYQDGDVRVVIVRLDRDESQQLHLGTIGTQWHLMLDVDQASLVKRIRLEDTSVKILRMIHGMSPKPYKGPIPPETVQAEQGGVDQPATAPELKSEGKDKSQPESKVRPR